MNAPHVDLTGHPEVADTFVYPCHTCGQTVYVEWGAQQPHACRTYDTDTERACAAWWAGYNSGFEAGRAAADPGG